jgi:ATP-dependent RNA helicase DeaD
MRGVGLETIHGNMSQSQRDRVFQRLREGKIRLLVATDVVGRGIDVSTISHIINFDIPQDCDDYVHRVGRTGRMGREGIAFTFVARDEGNRLSEIEWRINRQLQRDPLTPSNDRPLVTPRVSEMVPVAVAPESWPATQLLGGDQEGAQDQQEAPRKRLFRSRRSLSSKQKRQPPPSP